MNNEAVLDLASEISKKTYISERIVYECVKEWTKRWLVELSSDQAISDVMLTRTAHQDRLFKAMADTSAINLGKAAAAEELVLTQTERNDYMTVISSRLLVVRPSLKK